MEFKPYTRKPFKIQAIEITNDNLSEIADVIGEVKENQETGTRYIAINKRVIPNLNRAYVGWYLTLLNDNFRCYSPEAFQDQFVQSDVTGSTGSASHISVYNDTVTQNPVIESPPSEFGRLVPPEEMDSSDIPQMPGPDPRSHDVV